ncbi:MAG: hypothetical protein ABJA78_17640 [Ferruginibacter sp.]
MADIKDEEHLDNPIKNQSENPPDEIILTKDTEAINPNQETQNMEVHKHPHHVTHKKKWGEYLLEFIMLFLAVFLGFIAENIREHVVEQNRAKEFSGSLVRDLQNDTIAINNQIRSGRLYIDVSDSLLKLSKTQLEGRNAAQFSFYTRFSYWTAAISWNRSTFEQIKNSGSLRYFRNDSLLKKLLEYDAMINDINDEADNNKMRGNMLLTSTNSIIDPQLHHDLSQHFLPSLDTMSTKTRESFFSYKTGSLENKREKIMEMLNMVMVQQRNFRNQVNNKWSQAELLAVELITDLKKEYHLE